ncbi:DGF-1-like protein, putative [Bodo saltans]|uniref:DGF-1-like protein, putative n=1 Tax=Bodo saltans TaxID=75058 RepID=A0A0S4INU0_BODSA|nr:DGF-1-like protein, putative [Bodo saltans]|eukprot:CUE92747.1 DGF-1-like protein, putative [Bodo saltans]
MYGSFKEKEAQRTIAGVAAVLPVIQMLLLHMLFTSTSTCLFVDAYGLRTRNLTPTQSCTAAASTMTTSRTSVTRVPTHTSTQQLTTMSRPSLSSSSGDSLTNLQASQSGSSSSSSGVSLTTTISTTYSRESATASSLATMSLPSISGSLLTVSFQLSQSASSSPSQSASLDTSATRSRPSVSKSSSCGLSHSTSSSASSSETLKPTITPSLKATPSATRTVSLSFRSKTGGNLSSMTGTTTDSQPPSSRSATVSFSSMFTRTIHTLSRSNTATSMLSTSQSNQSSQSDIRSCTVTALISLSKIPSSMTWPLSLSHSASSSLHSPSTSPSTTPTPTNTLTEMTQTLSCPNTVRVSILPLNVTANQTANLDAANNRACLLRSVAEAKLQIRSAIACYPLYATASFGQMEVFPATRGPAPPFFVALRFQQDANWVLRLQTLTNTSSALLLDDPIGEPVGVQNITNLTVITRTLFVRVDATPEWQSQIIVQVDAACGFHHVYPQFIVTWFNHVYPQFIVTWPQKQLGTATQVIVGLVSGGSTVSGNPTAASALALVGLLSCSGSTPALQSAGYFVSLFFNLGPAAVSGGNLGIIAVILGLHYVVVRIWLWYCKGSITEEQAMADFRFPALTIFAALYLLPGTVYGAVVCIASDDNRAVGIVLLCVVAFLVIASQVYLLRYVVPHTNFDRFPVAHPTAFTIEKILMLPSSRWIPEEMERRYMPLMGTRVKSWCMLSITDLLLAICLSAATGLGVGTKGASCSVMPLVVAVVYLSCALVHIVVRPHRRPLDAVIFPVVWTLFGALCIFKYMNSGDALVDNMQLGLSGLQLFQTATAVLVFLRERQWRAYVRQVGEKGEDVVILDELDDPYAELWSRRSSGSSSSTMSEDDVPDKLQSSVDFRLPLPPPSIHQASRSGRREDATLRIQEGTIVEPDEYVFSEEQSDKEDEEEPQPPPSTTKAFRFPLSASMTKTTTIAQFADVVVVAGPPLREYDDEHLAGL